MAAWPCATSLRRLTDCFATPERPPARNCRPNVHAPPDCGYLRIHVLFQREGWHVNAKCVCRLYREIGLQSRPGKSTDNVFIESLNGKFRAECLNANWFRSLDEARSKCEVWRRDYNEVRPHESRSKTKCRSGFIFRPVIPVRR